jgi:hypothetical protein
MFACPARSGSLKPRIVFPDAVAALNVAGVAEAAHQIIGTNSAELLAVAVGLGDQL